MGTLPIQVTLIGAGQVGRALAKSLRANSIGHRLFGFRRGLPQSLPSAGLILICVRDSQIPAVVDALLRCRFSRKAVVAHVSGALGPEVLKLLKPRCRGVGQLHPFSSIRATGHARQFALVHFLGAGDSQSLATLRRLVRQLRGKFVEGNSVDGRTYHLAAALLANGTIALMHTAAKILCRAGIPNQIAPRMLIELVRSVLDNASKLGIDAALTGPVRRGDIDTIQGHLRVIGRRDHQTLNLYRQLGLCQMEVVRDLDELEPRQLNEMKRLLGAS